MSTKRRKRVGLFVNRFDNAFQIKLSRALGRLTQQAGYDLLVFHSLGNKESYSDYENLDQLTVNLAGIETLDGVIIAPDTYIKQHRTHLVEQIKSRVRKGVAIVTVRSSEQGFREVLVDERVAIEGIIEHIIACHHPQRIAFLGGVISQIDAIMRHACFQRVMNAHDLPVPESAVYHGNFWRTCAKDAASYFFEREGAYKPDAIVCANDYMALGLMGELMDRGLRIPQDVIVTGYDNIPEDLSFTPTLTSVDTDYHRMAESAFQLIQAAQRGEDVPDHVDIPTRILYRESCGCAADQTADAIKQKARVYEQLYHATNTQIRQLYFNIGVSGCEDLSVIHQNIVGSLEHMTDFKQFAMCLCAEEGKDIANITYGNYIGKEYRISLLTDHHTPIIPADHALIPGSDPLPEVMCGDEPMAYYFNILHDCTQFFGYTVISYAGDATYTQDYQNWMVYIGSAISELCTRLRLKYALEQNEKMSVTDPLTGLLNRRGFMIFSNKQCASYHSAKSHVIMLCFDLDGLKTINDAHGHAEGDFALQAIADTIREVLDPNGIASRSGGDEFVAMFIGEENKGTETIERFQAALERLNQRVKKPYKISASVGMAQSVLRDDLSLEQLMRQGDRKLYEAKALSHKRNGC